MRSEHRMARRDSWIRRALVAALLLVLPLASLFVRGRPTEPAERQAEGKRDKETSKNDARKPVRAGKRTGTLMEARFLDDSALRLLVREERIELNTPYGKLAIPLRDIQRIELAFRIPEETAQRIDAAVADLGKANFEQREAASAELLELRDYSYPALVKAAKANDAEVVRRARELLEKIRDETPEERLVFRPYDVVYTADSMNTGRLVSTAIKVHTFQFGEQQLQLSDVRQLRSPSAVEAASADALPDPGTLSALHGQIGRSYHFRVTGAVVGGFIYGTDVYTTDSNLSVAAVHAGVLKAGQTGIVRVKILGAQPAFLTSTRHGVTSQGYGTYPGSFQFVRGRGRAE